MESLWKLNFSEIERIKTKPEVIVEQQCKFLEQLTEGRVTARVMPHEQQVIYPVKEILRKDTGGGGAGPAGPITLMATNPDKLGDIGTIPKIRFKFEFYLTSPSTPRYKFRIMFFNYVKGQYPVGIKLDADIATEIHETEFIKCSSEDDFIMVLARILNSNKVKNVINALNLHATEPA